MIFQALFLLAFALLRRSKGSNQTEDATYAAKYLCFLRGRPHAALGFPRHAVTTLLVGVLAFQAELGAVVDKAVQNIEELAVLCHEHLTLDASDSETTRSTTLFESLSVGPRSAIGSSYPATGEDKQTRTTRRSPRLCHLSLLSLYHDVCG